MFEINNVLTLVSLVVGIFASTMAAVWSLSWWLSGHFTAVRQLFYSELKKLEETILRKLEYHEKHDDTRFTNVDSRLSNIRDDIWDIRVRNSARDGLPALKSRDRPVNGEDA